MESVDAALAGRLGLRVRAQTHLRWVRGLSRPAYLGWMTGELFLLQVPALIVTLLLGLEERTDLKGGLPLAGVYSVAIFGPLFETALFQVLPITIARGRRGGWGWQLAVGTIPFGLSHAMAAWGSVPSALVAGLVFSFTYIRWREVSFSSALWMTFGLHAIHNTLLVAVMFFSPDFKLLPA